MALVIKQYCLFDIAPMTTDLNLSGCLTNFNTT